MNALGWIQVLALGGLLGAVGQGARAIVGLKKEYDRASQQGRSMTDDFRASELLTSLLIGFIAGVLASIPMHESVANATPQILMGLLAAGYSGTDFIEGFMQRATPAGGGTRQPAQPPSGQPSAAIGELYPPVG